MKTKKILAYALVFFRCFRLNVLQLSKRLNL